MSKSRVSEVQTPKPLNASHNSKHCIGIDEAGHLEFRVLVDTEGYYGTHDRLPPKGMCLRSRDLITVWEISGNISETVQDRDMVAMED